MSFSQRHRFTLLLAALVLLFLGYPLLTGPDAGERVFGGFTLALVVSVLLTLFQTWSGRGLALLLGLPSLAGLLTRRFHPEAPPELRALLFHAVPVGFLAYASGAIFRQVFRRRAVTLDEINGAFCGYLMLALAFGHLFCLVEAFRPGSFHFPASEAAASDGRQRFLLTYFSLITLTTVGYGDITPASDTARALAALEGVAGQFYVAVVIAELLALKVSAAQERPPEGRTG